jgi:uncharacterized membrane protein
MEELFNTAELNEMKEQISLLRRKLEKETIVNEKLIRSSMRDKLKAVKRRSYILCAVAIGVCPLWATPIFDFHSIWFKGVTIAFLFIAVAYEIYCNQLLSTQNYVSGNLIDEARKLSRYKQLSRQWHWFSIPFLFIWLSWFVYEATSIGDFHANNILIGGLIGGTIGGVIGWRIYRKGQNAVSEVIEQIEDLTGEKE